MYWLPKKRKDPDAICAAVWSLGTARKAMVDMENVNPAKIDRSNFYLAFSNCGGGSGDKKLQ
jgi:hypothetical protein